jgi:DNA methylase
VEVSAGEDGAAAGPQRVVHCAEALGWLRAQPRLTGCSFFTSMPDATELPSANQRSWATWFEEAAGLVCEKTPDDGAALFYQSDVKRQGLWVDKAFLVQKAAERAGLALLWHKIVCRRPPGTLTYGRAGYGHLLCFSRGLRMDLARATPDVLAAEGQLTWVRAVGVAAARLACRFVLEETPTRTVVDPFCGLGTALAAANELGLAAIGVELNQKRARKARSLVLPR